MNSALTPWLLAAAVWLLPGVAAIAQVVTPPRLAAEPSGDTAWVAYRDVYREMILFEKYGKPKQFLQNHLRIAPRDRAAVTDGLRLSLVSKSVAVQLQLDGLGRTAFPLSRKAFDENAELRLNRKAGLFAFSPWLSIVSRADGVYEAPDLRTACEQALAYLHYLGRDWVRGKKCTGVQFSYARGDADAEARFRKIDRTLNLLSAQEGGAFPDDVVLGFKVIAYRFADWPESGQIVTRSAPLAIAPLIEN